MRSSYSPVEHLALSVMPNERLAMAMPMVMLTAYYDAAGHPAGDKVLVVGGYVSQVRTWVRFEKRWKKALGDVGETEMHLTDFMSSEGKYARWKGKTKEKAALILALSKLIDRNTHKSFCQAVLLDDWRAVNEVYQLKESHCTPYALASFFVMDRTVRWWGTRKKNSEMRFVFEDCDHNKGDFIWMMDTVMRPLKRALRALSPIFEHKKFAPLQAADFVAWANRRAMQVKTGDNSKRLQDELALAFAPLVNQKDGKNRWAWLDRERLIHFCEQYDVPKRGESRKWAGPRQRAVRS